MRSTRQRQWRALSATLTLAVVIVGLLRTETAIRQGTGVPPAVDVRLYGNHILAYHTDYPDCPPTTLCPPQFLSQPARYYVIWSITELVPEHQPYGSTAKRLLVVPLNRIPG